MRSYNTGDTDLKNADIKERGPAINGTLFFGMDFGLLTGQAEIILTNEQAEIDTVNIDISGMSLLVPFIFKVDFHLGPVVLQPLAGLYLNFALGKLETRGMGIEGEDPYANPLFGLMFGGSAGISLGRGILFLDSRYAMDLGRTVAGNDPKTIWRRSALMFNLGYQFSIRSGR
jgi:hypothetical protein